MNKYLPLIAAILLLAIAYFTGYSKYLGLAWYGKATLIGGTAGILLALLAQWLKNRPFDMVITAAFAITVAITLYYARIFIDSADFERTAGMAWYIGYHIGVALFIPTTTIIIAKFLPRRPQ